MPSPHDIAALLLRCEIDGPARPYVLGGGERPDPVIFDAEEREVVIVSDLHMGAGLDADGRYAGTENFFCDDPFARFVDHFRGRIAPGRGLLVINGDVVDFIRITDFPDSSEAAAEWSAFLAEIGIVRSAGELGKSVSPRERKFGLKTQDYKSAWRLRRSMRGHPAFFASLARWLSDGNRLMILKGNHDLEWYWLAVRNTLRLELAKSIASASGRDLHAVLVETVLPGIDFIDDAVVIDKDVYIEHGHRYDKYTRVLGDPVLKGGEELNLPFGSFFNRYLVNRLELAYPYLDNVRPRENILPLMIRERFPLALKILWQHIPMLRVIPKGYWRYMLNRVFSVLLVLAAPIALFLYLFWPLITGAIEPAPQAPGQQSGLVRHGLNALGSIGSLVLSYFLARIAAWFQLEEPDSLTADGEKILKGSNYRVVTMGHTHIPDQIRAGNGRFFNTGTWIPLVETTSGQLRDNRTFCFLRLYRDSRGALQPDLLQRWDDAGNRPELLTIIKRD